MTIDAEDRESLVERDLGIDPDMVKGGAGGGSSAGKCEWDQMYGRLAIKDIFVGICVYD
jgi:hypothetical protein